MSGPPAARAQPASDRPSRALSSVLWLLLFVFFLRVLGHALVVFFDVSFLPDEEQWLSGLISYSLVLPAQLLTLLLFGKVCLDFTRGYGFFVTPRWLLATPVITFGAAYLGVMVVRYTVRMGLYPPERWTGGSLPTFAHWVLALFLLLAGVYHLLRLGRLQRPAATRQRWVRWLRQTAWAVGGLLVTAAVLAWVAYQLGPWYLGRQLDIRSPEFAVRVERGVSMVTSDGTELVSDVYHPQTAGEKRPTILVRIPFTKTFSTALVTNMASRMWAERGYTVVVQGTRGRAGSGGTFYPLLGEREDGIETLAWLAEQPWYDGRIGMWGGSAFGHTQWVLADQTDPGPSAYIIQIASTNFHGMFYPGGGFSLESALHWAASSHGERDVTPSWMAMDRGFDGFPLREADDRAVGDVSFFNDWVDHPQRDEYWVAVDGDGSAGRLQAPALLMAGWYDPFLPTQLDDFVQVRREAPKEVASATRLIIGPWTHARTVSFPGVTPRNYRIESLAPSVPWFDQHLQGEGIAQYAPIRLYVMGEHVWRDEQEWPLARTRYTPYYLRSSGHANTLRGDGALNTAAPALQEPSDTYIYNPQNPVPTAGGAMLGPRSGIALQNDVEARPDVLVYTTPPLEEDLEVTGPVKLFLYVSTTVPHTDFTAKLVDVHPDGAAYNVSEGVLRREYVMGQERSVEIEVELWPTSMLFRQGHRIRLEVASSNYPRFDRNPNTGTPVATETRTVAATQTVYHGPNTPSRLILPVIPR